MTGYGYAGDIQPVAAAELAADGNRIEYQRTSQSQDLSEWYVNDAHGLEQGFTLAAPPPSDIPDPKSEIILELALAGDLTPNLIEDGKAIEFTNPSGVHVLGYSDLDAYDATGRSLSTRLHLVAANHTTRNSQQTVHITVNDTGAMYPIEIKSQ